MSVTIRDVARVAGVSASTVSRVIHDDPRISGETKSKVMDCIQRMDYKTNAVGRWLKTSKTWTIGFLAPQITDRFFMEVAQGAEEELRRNGYSLLISCTYGSPEGERDRLRMLAERSIDGLILIPCRSEGKHLEGAIPQGMPLVLADRLAAGLQADAVISDHINGTYAAVEHLIGSGCRRIAFIGSDAALTPNRERLDGYRRALKDYMIPYNQAMVLLGTPDMATGYRLAGELMQLPEAPEYILAADDDMHMGVMEYLLSRSDVAPASVKLAGYSDMNHTRFLGLNGLTIRQPAQDIGKKAAKLLLERAKQPMEGPRQIIRLKTMLQTEHPSG